MSDAVQSKSYLVIQSTYWVSVWANKQINNYMK